MAHGPCRTPVCRPCQRSAFCGSLRLGEQGSDPYLLTDSMQTSLLQQLIPSHSLTSLVENLQAKRNPGGQWLDSHELEQLYGHCGIPTHQWSRVTNLLEKLAIVKAAEP